MAGAWQEHGRSMAASLQRTLTIESARESDNSNTNDQQQSVVIMWANMVQGLLMDSAIAASANVSQAAESKGVDGIWGI